MAMRALETTLLVPLTVTESGAIRITGSRVSLDSIVHHFKLGATPEQIAHSFPVLQLADIYAVIAFYLNNRVTVEEYLKRQDAEADTLQQRIESDPRQQAATAQLREWILKRWAVRQAAPTSTVSD